MSFLSPASAPMRPVRQRAIGAAVDTLPDPVLASERILAVYGEATALERNDGAHWYPVAGRIASQVSDACGHLGDVRYGAGLIAALSPQCPWDQNIIRAFDAAETGLAPFCSADQVRKVAAILDGTDPTFVLGGRKVRSFYANLLGSESAVTIDRHALAMVCGRPQTDREAKVLERPGAYAYVAGLFRATARQLDIPPSTLQAITWLAWRRLKGDDDLGDF